MRYVAGHILGPDGFREGHLGIERGAIVETGDGDPPQRPVLRGIITPSFINCHTHVADADVRLDLSLPLEELVAPPHGLKHRQLGSMDEDSQRASMRRAMDMMLRSGTSRFIDFREGGERGSAALRSLRGPPSPVIMGRPAGLSYDEEEVERLLRSCDGIGVSAVSDWRPRDLEALAEHARQAGRPFALHVSEARREDIEAVLSLQPSFLVHMCSASDADMRRVADEGLSTVVCPRSNLFMGLVPPLARMAEAGMELALGTDNFMNCDGDMRAEMECMARLLRSQQADASLALSAAFLSPRKLLNLQSELPMAKGGPADLVAFEHQGSDPICDLLFRSGNVRRTALIRQ